MSLRQDHFPETAREKAYDAAYRARLNMIYFGLVIKEVQVKDQFLRIGSLLLSSGGIYGTVRWLPTCFPEWPTDVGPIVVGFIASTLTMVTLIMNYPEQLRSATLLLSQYTEHAQRLEALYLKGDRLSESEFNKALEELNKTEKLESEKRPVPDTRLIKKAERQLDAEIGADAKRDRPQLPASGGVA